MKWKDGHRHGCRTDLGNARTVEVEYDLGFIKQLIHVRAGDCVATYGSDGTQITGNGCDIDVRTNFDPGGYFSGPRFEGSPFYVLTLVFGGITSIDIHIGEPNTLYYPPSKPLLRMAPAWRDKDIDAGVEWVSTVLEEEVPWPETGLAAGMSIWSRKIYEDKAAELVYSRYPTRLSRLTLWP